MTEAIELHSVATESNLAATMRDGTVLQADVYRPDAPGRFPVLLMRLPYDKFVGQSYAYVHPTWYARQGFVVVVQDCRGRGQSEGEFELMAYEGPDGYDTVEWAAALPWSSGRVGMYGFSYVGMNQIAAATLAPPHLVAIAPAMSLSDYYSIVYPGGALSLAQAQSWSVEVAIGAARRRGLADVETSLRETFRTMHRQYRRLPLSDFPALRLAPLITFYDAWLKHPTRDEFWDDQSLETKYDRVLVPAMHIGGWYDALLEGTIRNFLGLRRQAGTDEARRGQRLVIGPWYHLPWNQVVGALDFGPDASGVVDPLQLRWFNYWLRGVRDPIADEPSVMVFTMGANRWQYADDWPPSDTRAQSYYLHSGGRANSLGGDGTLSVIPPDDEPSDVYIYDPGSPVPSLGGHSCCFPDIAPMGPADQRPVEARHDVLVYSTQPLERDLEVTGTVTAVLWASSSAPDTDFTVKLVDVFPDGRAINLADGIIRARYRDSFTSPELLQPGTVYEFHIRVGSTSNLFRTGHQVRIEIASGSFPAYDRNANTGHAVGTDSDADLIPARQTVFHDRAHPSSITLPVRER